MTKTLTVKSKLSINVQHDYITLRTPNGNYTTSWGGSKSSGKLASHRTAFNNIDKYVQKEMKTSKLIDVMTNLTIPSVLSTLWSEWNEVVTVNDFEPTQRVVFTNDFFIKRYPNGGVVQSVSRKNVYIKLVDGKYAGQTIGFDYQTLKRV